MHKRYHQKKHQFKYNDFNMLIDIEDLKDKVRQNGNGHG